MNLDEYENHLFGGLRGMGSWEEEYYEKAYPGEQRHIWKPEDWQNDAFCRQRQWEVTYLPTTTDFDDFLGRRDKLRAEIGELAPPQVSEKEKQMGTDYHADPTVRDTYINHHWEDPEGWLREANKGLRERLAALMPADMVHLHDAVFPEGEKVSNTDPTKNPARVRYWWDEDVIEENMRGVPRPQDAPEEKVNWYLRQAEKHDQEERQG